MPDGSMMHAKIESAPTETEFLDDMIKKASETLARALDDVGGAIGADERLAIETRFERHARERFAQTASLVNLELGIAEERGAEMAKRAIAHGAKVVADAMAIARRTARATPVPTPAPATSRHPMEELVRFTTGAAEQLRKNLSIGVLAVAGKMRRGELPALERRTDAVYMACALGRAAGDTLSCHLAITNPDDVRLARAMREAFVDGMNVTFGSFVDELSARSN